MVDWKDFAVVLCLALTVLGAAALSSAAQTFAVIKGKVLEKGIAVQNFGNTPVPTHTISVLIENNDRVFRIDRGSVVKYAISDGDAKRIAVGSEVNLLISSYQSKARLISIAGTSPV